MRATTLPGRIGVVLGSSLGFQVLYVVGLVCLSLLFVRNIPADPTIMPRVLIVADGHPLLTRGLWTGRWSEFTDLEGKPVALAAETPVQLGVHLAARGELAGADRMIQRNYSAAAFGLVDRAERWYFVQERIGAQNTGFFAMYLNGQATKISYLGRDGPLNTPPSPDQKFHLVPGGNQSVVGEDGRTVVAANMAYRPLVDSENRTAGFQQSGAVYVITTSGLDRVDLRSQTVTRMVEATGLVSINVRLEHTLNLANAQLEQSRMPPGSFLLRSRDTVFHVDGGNVKAKFAIPPGLLDTGFAVFFSDASSIAYSTNSDPNAIYGSYVANKLFQCDATGRILKETDIEQPKVDTGTDGILGQLFVSVICPAPIQLPFALVSQSSLTVNSARALAAKYPLGAILPILCGCLAVIGAWKLTPRFCGAPAGWGWLVLVFILGLPGMIGYLLHFRRRIRPVLAPPAKQGTEVFG